MEILVGGAAVCRVKSSRKKKKLSSLLLFLQSRHTKQDEANHSWPRTAKTPLITVYHYIRLQLVYIFTTQRAHTHTHSRPSLSAFFFSLLLSGESFVSRPLLSHERARPIYILFRARQKKNRQVLNIIPGSLLTRQKEKEKALKKKMDIV